MTDTVDFRARLSRDAGTGSAAIVALPFDVRALFGRARCPVRVTVNGHSWRTTTQLAGDTYHVVINADARAAAGVSPGDDIDVQVIKDDTVRIEEVPGELAARLRTDPEAKRAFESLAPSHRREYARWIAEAKLPATRIRRSEAALERLKSGVRRPQSA